MLLINNGETPGSKLIGYMLQGGKVPEHLMDVPISTKCSHRYLIKTEDTSMGSFHTMECQNCKRTYVLEDKEVQYHTRPVFRDWVKEADRYDKMTPAQREETHMDREDSKAYDYLMLEKADKEKELQHATG